MRNIFLSFMPDIKKGQQCTIVQILLEMIYYLRNKYVVVNDLHNLLNLVKYWIHRIQKSMYLCIKIIYDPDTKNSIVHYVQWKWLYCNPRRLQFTLAGYLSASYTLGLSVIHLCKSCHIFVFPKEQVRDLKQQCHLYPVSDCILCKLGCKPLLTRQDFIDGSQSTIARFHPNSKPESS